MAIFVSTQMRLRLYVWSSLALGLAFDVLGLQKQNISFELGAAAGALQSMIYMTSFCVLYAIAFAAEAWLQKDFLATCFYRCAVFVEVVFQFIAFFIIYLVLSYIAAASIMPYQDRAFAYADELLHLDWHGYVAWVDAHDLMRRLLAFSYYSPMAQLLVALMILGVAGQYSKMSRVMLTLILSAVICIVIAALMPAEGFITYRHINPTDFPHLSTQLRVGYVQAPIIEQLRAGTFHTLLLTSCVGLVSFPSFHASLGVILTWTFSSVAWIRWPIAVLNLCEIAATPAIGGHYFVDTISGALIALCALRLVSLLGREKAHLPNLQERSGQLVALPAMP